MVHYHDERRHYRHHDRDDDNRPNDHRPPSRFFPHFPDLCQQSIDAMLDLCEDGNVMIRMQAIKVTNYYDCTVYNLQFTMDNLQFTMDNGQCTMDNVQWTMDNVQWTMQDMPNLCRDSQIKTLPKIADVLTQLLQVPSVAFYHQYSLRPLLNTTPLSFN